MDAFWAMSVTDSIEGEGKEGRPEGKGEEKGAVTVVEAGMREVEEGAKGEEGHGRGGG